ncbi:hypothetical protein J1N09_10095 [Aureitalea sp. L0-47]|uniref:hypothetical protein n=1 Tax=Aureitalea sp. L0-47 TaxID=2816962 RepID=UPI0022385C5F|nr:hypothetical protein [Aureitalea sp. L0-47]MCW5520189.1 hypothetical protein [Aureitalea sp. L0-47]
MKNYLTRLLSEKGIPMDHSFLIPSDSPFGNHLIPMDVVIEFISCLDLETQLQIKWRLVKIDFNNGDILHFLEYLCKGMVQLKFPQG